MARTATGSPTPREKGYIDAVAGLFSSADAGTQRARVLAYEKATEALNEFAFGMRPLPDSELEHLSRILRDVRIAEGDFEDMR